MQRISLGLILIAATFTPAKASVEVADSTISLGEVVVTGTNVHLSDNLLPYTVSVIGEERIESTGKTQILSAISGMVPSLFVSERNIFGFGVSNGGSGHIKLRGVGGDRSSAVLMMVDGQPQFAGIYSHHIADFYDKEYISRVEILRGPGSVIYGSNAMTGAINLITRNSHQNGVHTTVSTQYGSYNTWLTSATNTNRFGKFSSLASVSYNRTDGSAPDFDFNQSDGYIKIGYDLSNSYKLSADYSLMHFNGNDPIYPKLSDPESTDIYHQNITRGEGSLTLLNKNNSTDGLVRAYYSYGNHFVDDPRHFHSTDDRFGIMFYQNFHPWHGANATVGFDFDTYSGRIPISGGKPHTDGSMTTMGIKRINEYSPYITINQVILQNLIGINGGLKMANSDKFGTHWIPQIGLSVNPGHQLTIKGNIAVGYRNPSFRELYLYKMANPELMPEKMTNYEMSVRKYFSQYLTAEITLYYSHGCDMIQVLENKNTNTGSFINKGIEITASSQPIDNLQLFASYSYLHTTLNDLTGAPKNQYYIGGNLSIAKRFTISADIKGVGGLFVSEDIDSQSYVLFNIKLSYKLLDFLELFTRLENITNTHYVINRGYDMPGFTAMGGFKIHF